MMKAKNSEDYKLRDWPAFSVTHLRTERQPIDLNDLDLQNITGIPVLPGFDVLTCSNHKQEKVKLV